MNLDQFLQQDIEQAAREHRCYYDLLNKLEEKFIQRDFDGCKQAAVDIINTAQALQQLRERKERHDELQQVSKELIKQGILCAVVRRFDSEKV
ncbi:hypothetical protein SAMN05421743_105190 [Thalassobacillus cyri]|uniref:Uncharacterized protein n=1 Tax=Thalassobacillus cyri TaxID=571932 RepID=A0A1H4BXU0_9BACI|nr:YqaH family protein [Thalassobacillus cyri]SEA52958.1 hypothetical protein SAMN05421743_105190 [Thalassobacillus cyri]